MLLAVILNRQSGKVLMGFRWLGSGTSGGLLWVWRVNVLKGQVNSWSSLLLFAVLERICSIKSFTYLIISVSVSPVSTAHHQSANGHSCSTHDLPTQVHVAAQVSLPPTPQTVVCTRRTCLLNLNRNTMTAFWMWAVMARNPLPKSLNQYSARLIHFHGAFDRSLSAVTSHSRTASKFHKH